MDLATLLKGELTIGCNEEYRWNPTVTVSRDARWLKNRLARADYQACTSIRVYAKPHPHITEPFDIPDWVYMAGSTRIRKRVPWGTSLFTGLASQSNCGIGALNLADVLGADPIYLIGFDCKTDDKRRTHGHDRYPWEWGTNPRRFKRWVEEFIWASKLVRAKVYNLNPQSAIECFEKRDLHALAR